MDAFVTKINPDGSALLYSTYLGESLEDNALSLTVDGVGNAVVTGFTNSPNFPLRNSLKYFSPGFEVFVTKLNDTGNGLVYSTYLGGSDDDFANGIALDHAGNAHLTGWTTSPAFPIVDAVQPHYRIVDPFVMKMSASGDRLIYAPTLEAVHVGSSLRKKGAASPSIGWAIRMSLATRRRRIFQFVGLCKRVVRLALKDSVPTHLW